MTQQGTSQKFRANHSLVFVPQPGGQKQPSQRRVVASHAIFNHHQKKRLVDVQRHLSLQRRQEVGPPDEASSSVLGTSSTNVQDQGGAKRLESRKEANELAKRNRADPENEYQRLSAVRRLVQRERPQTLLDGIEPCAPNLSPDTKVLFRHYVNDLVYRLFSARKYTDAVKKWLIPLALTKPIALHAISALSSTHIRHLTLGQDGAENLTEIQPLRAKLALLHAANEHLQNPKEWGPETFLALFALISIELQAGSLDAAMVHTRGLAKFVETRGNDTEIPDFLFGMMHSCVYPIASATASSTRIAPSPVSAHDTARVSFLAQKAGSAHFTPMIEGFIAADAPFLDPRMMSIVHELRDYLILAECARQDESDFTLTDLQMIQHKKWDVTCRLMGPLPDRDRADSESVESFMERQKLQDACQIAFNLLEYNLMKGFVPASSIIVRCLIGQLSDVLQRSDMLLFWQRHGEVLFWILFIGSNCCRNQPEWSWYLSKIAQGAEVLKVNSWEEVRQILLRFFYVAFYMEEPYEEIWQTVKDMRLKGITVDQVFTE